MKAGRSIGCSFIQTPITEAETAVRRVGEWGLLHVIHAGQENEPLNDTYLRTFIYAFTVSQALAQQLYALAVLKHQHYRSMGSTHPLKMLTLAVSSMSALTPH